VDIQSAEPRGKKHGRWRAQMYTVAHHALISRQGAVPTEQERNMVLTGFMLSILSIVTAIFPICGIPIACTGLVMGVIGRRIRGVSKVATWTIVLSIIGGTLGLINIVITVGIYINRLLWGG
jgi:hypothetical protein